jgi:LmbE family N-acetylglucosaminyl deacetylase
LEFVHGGQYNWSSRAAAVTLDRFAKIAHRKIMPWIEDLLERTLILVAHPDDECIAFGALLQRIREPLVVFATNGSPADPYFWQKYGSREAYAELRRQEALHSMHAVGVKDVLFLADMPGGENLVDQELFRNLRAAYELLADVMARRMITALLTLAYEGGHPDHDSCSLLAAQLAHLASIPCWEAPLYHRNLDGSGTFQDFLGPREGMVDVEPTGAEQERKRQMCRSYPSQGDFLQRFDVAREIIRPQTTYDYTRPPHEGKTNYEVWQWSMTAEEVSQGFTQFLDIASKHRARH